MRCQVIGRTLQLPGNLYTLINHRPQNHFKYHIKLVENMNLIKISVRAYYCLTLYLLAIAASVGFIHRVPVHDQDEE